MDERIYESIFKWFGPIEGMIGLLKGVYVDDYM